MEIFEPGTKVVVAENLTGTIVQVLIEAPRRVQYKVSWWNGRSRSCEWLESFEFEAHNGSTKVPIGFVGAG